MSYCLSNIFIFIRQENWNLMTDICRGIPIIPREFLFINNFKSRI